MSDEKPKRKGGRPAKSAEGKATRNLTFRTRDSLREKLSEAAAASHRSISEEIEHRLQRSFNRDELSQHIDGLLSDSLVKGEEVERAKELYPGKAEVLDTEARWLVSARLRRSTPLRSLAPRS